MTLADYGILWIGGLLTLMIFSFLYKDNPYYKFAEHLFVGVSAGYVMVVAFWTTLIPNMLGYLFPKILSIFTVSQAEAETVLTAMYEIPWHVRWLRLAPMIFGLMMLTRLLPKGSWLSRWPMAFIIGFAAGTNLTRYLQSDFIAQIQSTIIPLIVVKDGAFLFGPTLTNIVIVFGLLSALVYFFFSKEHKGWFGATAKSGIWVLMVAFGAAFGYTVMARISLLIGRFSFLGEWIGSVF